jgi:Protein of unknown function (DUF3435)
MSVKLEYAFLDKAFASDRIKEPRDIWRYTHVPAHRLSTPLHFKESIKDIPVFRRAMRDFEGKWITDPVQAFQYDRVQEYEIAASKLASFKNPSSLYKYRKGAAANECPLLLFLYINLFVGHLDEHSRNNIMGHKRSGTFAHCVQVRG